MLAKSVGETGFVECIGISTRSHQYYEMCIFDHSTCVSQYRSGEGYLVNAHDLEACPHRALPKPLLEHCVHDGIPEGHYCEAILTFYKRFEFARQFDREPSFNRTRLRFA